MNVDIEWLSRIGRVAHAHTKLVASIAIGVAVFALLPSHWNPMTRVLCGWAVGVACYLVVVAWIMAQASVADIRRHADAQDEGAGLILVLTVAAALASLGAIFIELAAIERIMPYYGLHIALAIATVILSWMFTHTIFALHYAHEFYGKGGPDNGLSFPGDEPPDYWDFVYFSFVIGMTFQVSDVSVTDKRMRRLVVAHGALSFLFSTAIVAMTVNIAANALQK
jgi:uncharacterized membrane protein